MKVYTLIISFIFILSGTCFGQNSDEKNYIYWSDDYELVWSDFEELPQRYSEHSAFSVVGYESQFNMTDDEYSAVIKTYFSKNESWSKSWVALLLLHEQGHFDLAELYARKFRKRLKEAMMAENISVSKFEEMNDEAIQELNEAQKEYDQATNFSMDYRAQLKRSEQIKEELKMLEDFANPEIIVSRIAN